MVREIDADIERRRNPWRRLSPTVKKATKEALARGQRKKAAKEKPKPPPARRGRQVKRRVNLGYLKDYFRDKSVAVVGNSFDDTDIQDAVDSHDEVVRFNLDEARLIYGYTQVQPQVPAGTKTTIMSGFWNRMDLTRILSNYPSIKLLVTLRPPRGRMNSNFIRAGMYEVETPNYITTAKQYASIGKILHPPVLCGMVFTYILLQANTAKRVDFYNFNFYVPTLDADTPDVQKVYKKYSYGRKGARYYGDKRGRNGHDLTTSYKWFMDKLNKTPNFHWDVTPERRRKMENYLL